MLTCIIVMIQKEKIPLLKTELKSAQTSSLLFSRPGFLLRRLHQIHCGLFAEETSEFNITPVQYSLLTALEENGTLDQNSLAIEIGLERTSVAEVLPRLEARGLIERQQSIKDKRIRLVKLSRKGKSLAQKMRPAVQRAHDRTIEYLLPEERDFFMLQLIKLVKINNEHSVVPLRLR